MVRHEAINRIKNGSIISKTNRIGQKENFQLKTFNHLLRWAYWTSVGFSKNEKRKIFIQSPWLIRKVSISMVCQGVNNLIMVTVFQQKVYDALLLIPKGKVTTYKLLWDFIGCRGAQAIGQALTRNPHAPKVPCHRVIKTDMTIGGYAFWVSEKQDILLTEGVHFDENHVLIDHKNTLYTF